MDRSLRERVRTQVWFNRYPRGWPFLLFLLTGVGTLLSVLSIERAEAERRNLQLDLNVTEIASALQRRAAENIAILKAGSALFATNEQVSARQFTEIAAGLHTNNDFHGSMGIGWARWLPPSDHAAFQREAQATYGPTFRVYPGWPRSTAVPILYLEPSTQPNRAAIGFDMYSDAARSSAMNAAIRLEQPVASGPVNLVQYREQPSMVGFLIYMPVFRWEEGRRTVRGFIYSPFRAEEFLASAVELMRNHDVEVAVYDEVRRPDRLLAVKRVAGENQLTMDRAISIANRRWLLSVSVKGSPSLSMLSRVTLLFGAVLGLLVMLIARLITKRAAEDREVAEWLSGQSAIRTSLTRELNHRVKNTLANVLSIVALTRRRSADIDDFAESLTGRIRALSATHDLLSQTDWSEAPIAEIVRSELAPYMTAGEGHVDMAGPDISLAPNDALSLGLAIHELSTNAAKYGALSVEGGRVQVYWSRLSPDLAEVRWREIDGPPVIAPSKRGFGRDLLEKIVAHELRSKVDLSFAGTGVTCTLQVPIRKLNDFVLRSRHGG